MIFTAVLLIIWLAPLLARVLRLPSVVILLTAGILLGEHGAGMLEYDQSFQLLGRIGMLYIMFLSAVEMDLEGFRRSRWKGMLFGIMTFAVPMALGIVTSRWLLGMDWGSCMLMVTVYAAHTLLTYPIISRYGLARHSVVSIAVGGTIVAVTLALLLLTAMNAYYHGLDMIDLIRYTVLLPLYLFLVFFIYPTITRRYLKTNPDPMLRVVYILTLVFLSAYLAEKVELQGILGAFFAGLALNKFVPASSPLMNRLGFLGNSLFIPFFLIGVGMQVDLGAFMQGYTAIVMAAVMIVTALLGKWLAAWLTAKLTAMRTSEGLLLFGLSGAKAAATLAVLMIGKQMTGLDGEPLLTQEVVSAAIILILFSCLVSSIVTDRAAKHIKAEDSSRVNVNAEQQILIELTPDNAEQLTLLALILNKLSPQHPLLAITQQRGEAAKQLVNSAKHIATAVDEKLEWVRLQPTDMNTAAVMRRQGVSTYITDAALCIHQNRLRWDDGIVEILDSSPRQVVIYQAAQPVNTIRRILLAVPRYADREVGFRQWLGAVCHLQGELGAKLIIYTNSILKAKIRAFITEQHIHAQITYRELGDWEDLLLIAKDRKENDLNAIVLSRPGGASYHPLMQRMPDMLSRFFADQPTMVIFPEQVTKEQEEAAGLFDLVNV